MTWKQTFTGRAVPLLDPRPADIALDDVAHSLARIARFDGHTRGAAYSVAQHSVLGGDALLRETGSRRLALLFLLHDGHEAYLSDLGTPVQAALGTILWNFADAWRGLRQGFDAAIHAAFGVPMPNEVEARIVKTMDLRMLKAERDALMADRPQDWHAEVETAAPIPGLSLSVETVWDCDTAEATFRDRIRRLAP